MIVVALSVSAFTHLWNVTGYPIPAVDEGIYLGRAIYFLNTFKLVDPYIGYDHPYFGQIVLSGILYVAGYQNFLTEPYGNSEILLQTPRILMGLLAVLDTFLIFRIVRIWYDKKMAFIASILFAVMPITLLSRWIILDSLQLPFILSSILFAIISGHRSLSDNRKNVLLVFVSGIFLGLSIFIKIPAFTMIPLISYLVYTQNKSLRMIALWIVPVLLIPSLWPLHAISLGQWEAWWDTINWQTHRESHSLIVALQDFFNTDAAFLVLGFICLIYAAIRKNIFILLFTIPYLIFTSLINYVDLMHLQLLLVAICIATAKFIVDIVSFTKNKNQLLHLSSIGIIAAILVLGFTITTTQITMDQNSMYFKAAEFINLYIEDGKNNTNGTKDNNGVTVISNPFFFWVDKYKYNNKNNDFWHTNKFETRKVIFIIDTLFKNAIERNDYGYGNKYGNLFSAFHTRQIASFSGNPKDGSTEIRVLETNLQQYNKGRVSVQEILDKDHHKWTNSKFVQLQQENGKLSLILNSTMLSRKDNLHYAYLNNTINFSRIPAYLQLSYYIPATTKGTFTVELEDAQNNRKLWDQKLRGPKGVENTISVILPQNLFQKEVNVNIKINSKANSIDYLKLNNFSIYY